MADHWVSLGVSLIGLTGLYALLRPMRGAGALSSTKSSPVHGKIAIQSTDPLVSSQSVKAKEEGQE